TLYLFRSLRLFSFSPTSIPVVYTLSLHDALPICARARGLFHARGEMRRLTDRRVVHVQVIADRADHDLAGVEPDADLHRHAVHRSEEHTSELQSPDHLVCRLLLEKKNHGKPLRHT